jgi:hypothetical protein
LLVILAITGLTFSSGSRGMTRTKMLHGPCDHCGATVRYQAELVGTQAKCPHCGEMTELCLAVPAQPPVVPRRAVIYTIIAVLILVMGLLCLLYVFKKAERWSEKQKGPAEQPK